MNKFFDFLKNRAYEIFLFCIAFCTVIITALSIRYMFFSPEEYKPNMQVIVGEENREMSRLLHDKITSTHEEIKTLLDQKLAVTQEKLERKIDKRFKELSLRMGDTFSQMPVHDSVNDSIHDVVRNTLREDEGIPVVEKHVKRIVRKSGRHRKKDSDVDWLVRQEVRKQIESLKSRRDPRIRRLKKALAVEKMRNLVKGLADGDDYDDLDL